MPDHRTGPHVVVVGAGVFGGWTALHLHRAGARVTLVDAWGAGHDRASSGGETRVLRHAYGDDSLYVDMVVRARRQWLEAERRWERTLFERTGLLWLVHDDEAYERGVVSRLASAGVAHEVLDVEETARRWPQVDLGGVRWAFVEPDAGVLHARRACEVVREAVVTEGGDWVTATARPATRPRPLEGGRLRELALTDGSTLAADTFVFACGPWLGALFPDVLGPHLRVSRQEVFTFDVPTSDTRHASPAMPVWADHGSRFWYGIPGNGSRGFKLCDDTRGAAFDPTDGDRTPSAEGLEAARAQLAHRFPALSDAPLLEARVCQYTNTPDGHFVVDRHPVADDVWLVGGGSGHGFKHGPVIGELVAGCVLGARDVEPLFSLARFD